MTTSWNTTRNTSLSAALFRVVGLAAVALCLCTLAADMSHAQQIPRRLDTLQLIRPIAPAPVPPVERLRQDIVRAINPRTGTIDVRELASPARPSRPGSGSAVGFGQISLPAAPSRPGGGAGLDFSQVSTPPPASRTDSGSRAGFQQLRPVRRPQAGKATSEGN
jgi:hypothetical protein